MGGRQGENDGGREIMKKGAGGGRERKMKVGREKKDGGRG